MPRKPSRTAASISSGSMAPFSPPAAVRPNTAPASSARSPRDGCGDTNPGPTSNSPTPAPSCSPDEMPNLMPDKGWQRPFDDPIPLSGGRQLVTLEDAAAYIMKLPKADQQLDEWQTVVEALLLVVELNGPAMMARIGVLRALNRNVERVFTDRKEMHWGRRR